MEIYRPKILIIPIVIIFGLIVFILGLEIANANKIILGVKAAGLNLGGLKPEIAQDILEKQSSQWQKNDLTLIYQNQIRQIKPGELGLDLETEKTLERAFSLGRGKNFLNGVNQQIKTLFKQNNFPFVFQINQTRLDEFINNQFLQVEIPVKNAGLVYNRSKKDFEIAPAQTGFKINRQKLQNDLEERIGFLSSKPIELVLIKEEPAITEEEAQKTYQMTSKILKAAPFFLKNQGRTWVISKETLIDWLSFEPKENVLEVIPAQEIIEDYLTALAPTINQPAVNARLAIENNVILSPPETGEESNGKNLEPLDSLSPSAPQNNSVVVLTPAQNKIELKIKESAALIAEKILEAPLNEPENQEKEIHLLIESSPALVREQTLSQLGLTALSGEGTSNFSGSPQNRIHNIKIGAAKFNGLLLKPNEEISFNALLGEIGPQQGYLPELVIKKNKTIPEYGGGLCQVSTTLFRAAVNSGLKITERYAHAFPVKYYNPQGFDATIYPPHPDLRFINDTDNYIFIQSKVEGHDITFEIFGADHGRQVKIIGPYILEKNEDGSMKAVLTQEVYQNGELLRKKTFYSNYKSPDLYPVERNPLE